MDKLSRVLPTVLRRRGLAPHAEASLIVHVATEWLHTALPSLKEFVHAVSVKDGTLCVGCGHSIAGQEVQPLLPSLMKYLATEYPSIRLQEARVIRV